MEDLATGSEDQTAKLWDVQTGREKAGLLGHTDALRAIAIAPDGKTIATGAPIAGWCCGTR